MKNGGPRAPLREACQSFDEQGGHFAPSSPRFDADNDELVPIALKIARHA